MAPNPGKGVNLTRRLPEIAQAVRLSEDHAESQRRAMSSDGLIEIARNRYRLPDEGARRRSAPRVERKRR